MRRILMQPSKKPTNESARKYPKLSEDEKERVLSEVKKLQDEGLIQSVKKYPSLNH